MARSHCAGAARRRIRLKPQKKGNHMAATFKKGDSVKAKSLRSGAITAGKFVQARPGAKGEYYDIDLGKENGGVKSFRPSQVQAA